MTPPTQGGTPLGRQRASVSRLRKRRLFLDRDCRKSGEFDPGWRGASSIGVVVGGVIAAIAGATGGSFGSDQSGAAVVACQDVVKQNLKSPSTASFPNVPSVSGDIITGEVDSENGFGAQLRASFQRTIVDDTQVRLDYLNNIWPTNAITVPSSTVPIGSRAVKTWWRPACRGWSTPNLHRSRDNLLDAARVQSYCNTMYT